MSGDEDDDDDFVDSDDDVIPATKDFDEFHVDLCQGCSTSLPLVNDSLLCIFTALKKSDFVISHLSSLYKRIARGNAMRWPRGAVHSSYAAVPSLILVVLKIYLAKPTRLMTNRTWQYLKC